MPQSNNKSAFVLNEFKTLPATRQGALDSLTFAVKELIAVQGFVTGCGNPQWQQTHPVAESTTPCVEQLLNAGATMLGKTIADEMAFSLDGENTHYGTPVNPVCPDRIPGGSSSGSASAVVSGVVDFALGTDTAGSVRIPAAYCGIYGFRPSHDVISLDGVHPMASSFDVVGWFANSAQTLVDVGGVLLDSEIPPQQEVKFVLIEALFDDLQPQVKQRYDAVIGGLRNKGLVIEPVELTNPDFEQWINVLRNIQWWELNQAHGAWIRASIDCFGEEIRGRLKLIDSVTESDYQSALQSRRLLVDGINKDIGDNTIAIFPTAHDVAPLKGRPIDEARAFRAELMKHTGLATVAGLPQVTVPMLEAGQLPLGLSMMAAQGQDVLLLSILRGVSLSPI